MSIRLSLCCLYVVFMLFFLLDGDGDLDFVTAKSSSRPNQIYSNDGNGVFSLLWDSPDTIYSTDVAIGDIDGDGDLDVAFANDGNPNQISSNIHTASAQTERPFDHSLVARVGNSSRDGLYRS